MATNKPKHALGENPLSKGIFTSTASVEDIEESKNSDPEIQESRIKKEESRKKNQENLLSKDFSFLIDSEKEKVNLRIPTELNDWLDDLIKTGKRKHGQKIPKEIWMQAALELVRTMPIDWSEIPSIEALREKLEELTNSLNNK